MKYLRTKTAAYMAAQGMAKITIRPILGLVDKLTDKYNDTKDTLEVRYIKANLDNMTPQEKFDATINHSSELAWLNDPIIDSTIRVLYAVRHPEKTDLIQSFEIAYAYLYSSGVQTFTPQIEAYHQLHINKVSV